MLERPHRCSEQDVRRGELVHVDEGAAADIPGDLHGVQNCWPRALES
ncbi:unnamed protein product [Ectocarpus sp. 8 AP-2014]